MAFGDARDANINNKDESFDIIVADSPDIVYSYLEILI